MSAAFRSASGFLTSDSRSTRWTPAHLAERAQEQDINSRQALVVLDVQMAYLISLKHQRLVQIAEETVRERGIIKGQIEALYRQQLKSKLDVDLVQVELTNAGVSARPSPQRTQVRICQSESRHGRDRSGGLRARRPPD